MTLTIHHLYADMMNLYGDRGNVISIRKRAEWRGIPVEEVVDVGLGESVGPRGCDVFLFGGGQDRGQALLAEDLSRGRRGRTCGRSSRTGAWSSASAAATSSWVTTTRRRMARSCQGRACLIEAQR